MIGLVFFQFCFFFSPSIHSTFFRLYVFGSFFSFSSTFSLYPFKDFVVLLKLHNIKNNVMYQVFFFLFLLFFALTRKSSMEVIHHGKWRHIPFYIYFFSSGGIWTVLVVNRYHSHTQHHWNVLTSFSVRFFVFFASVSLSYIRFWFSPVFFSVDRLHS